MSRPAPKSPARSPAKKRSNTASKKRSNVPAKGRSVGAKPRGRTAAKRAPAPPPGPAPLRGRAAWAGPAGLAAIAVLLVQLVWRGSYLAQGWFTQDDFLVLHLGGTSTFGPDYLFQDYSGRLFPGGFAIAFVEARLAPLSWPAAYVPTLLMELGAGVLMWIAPQPAAR